MSPARTKKFAVALESIELLSISGIPIVEHLAEMKIAIYSHSIAPSIDGVCRRFNAILHELQRQGHETLLFTMEDKPEELPESTSFVTLDHMIFPSYPNKKVARPTCRAIFRVYAALEKFRPDIIHVVADGYSQLFTLAGLAFGIPVVGSFHTDILDLLNTHGAYEVQKLLVTTKERIDSFVLDSCATTSESFKAKLANQGVTCEHVIITAVDMNTFSAKKRNEKLRLEMTFGDESGFLCVYVGRISNEKRLEVMINALKNLTGPRKAYLAIVGDGPSAGKYAKLHGPTNRIYCKPRFLNHVELAEVYASGDVHVSASQFETLGNTVLEAFSCSIPVVVPATQGFINTVNNTVNGFLFTPGDSDSARKYVQYLLDDNSLRVKMGAAGKSAVASNTIANVVKDLMQWYKVGSGNRAKRGAVNKAVCFLICVGFVALTVFMFAIYDIMVSYLLKPFISYAGDNHHVTKPREDIPRYASSDQLRNAVGSATVAAVDESSSSSPAVAGKTRASRSGKKVN